jgi:hypothetical protein
MKDCFHLEQQCSDTVTNLEVNLGDLDGMSGRALPGHDGE